MIESLSVRGYRGFEDYSLDGLKQVNLLVGKNNAGKTSVLEAIQILRSHRPLSTLSSISVRRQESMFKYVGRVDRIIEDVDLRHAFYGHQLVTGNTIEISSNLFTLTIVVNEPDLQPQLFEDDSGNAFEVRATRGDDTLEQLVVSDTNFFGEDARRVRRGFPTFGGVYISPDSLTLMDLSRLYNEVVLSASESSVIEALSILDPMVSGVYFLASERGVVDVNAGIVIGRNGTERVPIGSFGDGMRRLLALSMAFANAKGRELFVDEIDTGLHYSVMPDLWKLVLGAAQRLQFQVFATTHSLDCLSGLRNALQMDESLADIMAVHRVEAGRQKAVSLTGTELILALKHDLELR